MDDTLTDKQRHFVENISCGMPSRAAALAAGYSASFSKVAGHRFRRRPAVVAAVEAIREQGRTLAAYDLAAAMREANDAATFARANKNSMALVKAVELLARLSGLLIDRLELVPPVDMKKALAEAERRVIQVNPPSGGGVSLAAPGTVNGTVCWAASIAGTPVAEHTEAGPADGESPSQFKKSWS